MKTKAKAFATVVGLLLGCLAIVVFALIGIGATAIAIFGG